MGDESPIGEGVVEPQPTPPLEESDESEDSDQDDLRDTQLARITRHSLMLAFLVMIVVAFAISHYATRSLLNDLGTNVRWLSIAAVAVTALSGAACVTRWRVRPTRLLAVTFGCAAIYMLSVLAQFVPSRSTWSLVQEITWPAVPLLYALWLRTALNIAYHLRPDPTLTGGVYNVIHLFRRLTGWPKPLRWRSVPTMEPLISWLIALGFAVTGLVHHQWYYVRREHPARETWRHWTYHPETGFKVLAVWALVMSVLAAFALIGAWKVRGPGLGPGTIERGRWATRGSLAFVLFDALILWGSTRGESSEPLIDVLIAASIFGLALFTLDAEQYNSSVAAYASVARRSIGAAVWLVVVMVATLGYAGNALAKGVFAAALAVVYPLAPTGLRAWTGVQALRPTPPRPVVPADRQEAEPVRADPTSSGVQSTVQVEVRVAPSTTQGEDTPAIDEVDTLRVLLASASTKMDFNVRREVLQRSLDSLDQLNELEFRQLLGAIRGVGPHSRDWVFKRPSEAIEQVFLGDFPALEEGSYGAKLRSLVRLAYETAEVRSSFEGSLNKDKPSEWRWVTVFCLERALSDDPEQRKKDLAEIYRLRLYSVGRGFGRKNDDGAVTSVPNPYPLARLDAMTYPELEEELKRLSQRGLANDQNTAARRRQRAVERKAPEILTLWRERLQEQMIKRQH